MAENRLDFGKYDQNVKRIADKIAWFRSDFQTAIYFVLFSEKGQKSGEIIFWN